MFSSELLPMDCPPMFRMGRTPALSLSEQEKEDLFTFIRWHEQTASSLSVEQVEMAIGLMKADKQGLLADRPSTEDLMQRLQDQRPKYGQMWRDFKLWVKKRKPAAEHLSVSRLKAKTVYEITSCTPQIVSNVFSDLEALCHECGIMQDGVLLAPQCGRLVVVDEKGFSSRSDQLMTGVTTRRGKQTAASSAATTSFEHVTVTSWLPVNGDPLPPGVVVPFKKLHPNFKAIWPDAEFRCHDSGSQTPCLALLKI